MLLCIDIGNTNIKLGLFDGDKIRAHWRIATDRARLADEYAMLLLDLFSAQQIKIGDVSGIALSSVVPALTPEFADLAKRYLKQTPIVVGPGVKTGINIRTDHPAEVGTDLIVNAVAARALAPRNAPIIVIAFGTATAFSAVSASGDFVGVAIAPGVGTSAEALFRFAAKLPQVELARPPHAIGKNTVHSMQAGLIFGYAGLVEGLIKRMRDELGGNARVIATGGLAQLIASETTLIEIVEPNLTLLGLRQIYEMNKS
ncbi:MAG: type III pantothenate kinase [Chloroflexi bacterium]|nr:type III pantothenate kinase [Chloroflexota bacterium]